MRNNRLIFNINIKYDTKVVKWAIKTCYVRNFRYWKTIINNFHQPSKVTSILYYLIPRILFKLIYGNGVFKREFFGEYRVRKSCDNRNDYINS